RADVPRPEASGQAVNHAAGGLRDFGLGGEAHNGDDWAEDLLLGHAGFVVGDGEDGREVEVALVQPVAGALATGEHFGSFLAPQLDITIDALQVFGRYERADLGRLV